MSRLSLVSLAIVGPLVGGCDLFTRDPPQRPPARSVNPAQTVLPATDDGWSLAATFTQGDAVDRAVILAHQLASDRREWEPLLHRLRAPPAVTTLTVDLRGHGESVRGPLGDPVSWTSFGTDGAAWSGVVRDIEGAVRHLSRQGVRRVVLVGSSLGASACVRVGATRADVAAMVLISPGLRYHGIEVRDAFGAFIRGGERARRVMILGAAEDAPVAEAIPALSAAGVGRVEAETFAGERRHGVSLCNAHPERWDRVEAFIREVLELRRLAPNRVARDGGG